MRSELQDAALRSRVRPGYRGRKVGLFFSTPTTFEYPALPLRSSGLAVDDVRSRGRGSGHKSNPTVKATAIDTFFSFISLYFSLHALSRSILFFSLSLLLFPMALSRILFIPFLFSFFFSLFSGPDRPEAVVHQRGHGCFEVHSVRVAPGRHKTNVTPPNQFCEIHAYVFLSLFLANTFF